MRMLRNGIVRVLKWSLVALPIVAAFPAAGQAQIKVGIVASMTGPGASLGISHRNATVLMPKTIAGKTIEFTALDDASDPATARRNAERLVNAEKVDIILGSGLSPCTLAMVEIAGQSKTPMISFAAARSIVLPMDANRKWVFKTSHNDDLTSGATTAHMKRVNVKKVGIISFNDAYGESWTTEFSKNAAKDGIEVVAVEKYNKNDTSVTGQALKVIAARPDAVLIVAAGTPGVLPQATLRERGFKGLIYQTTGVTSNEFIRVGGAAVEGTLLASAPLIVGDQLPDAHPAKLPAVKFRSQYDQAYGPGTVDSFSGYAWDSVLMMQAAIPAALEKAQPGTPEFRAALRESIEKLSKLSATGGVVTMSPEDHNGFTAASLVMVTIKDGRWTYAE